MMWQDQVHAIVHFFPSRFLSSSVGSRAVSVRPQTFHSAFCDEFSFQDVFISVKQFVPRWVRAPFRVNQYGVQTIPRS